MSASQQKQAAQQDAQGAQEGRLRHPHRHELDGIPPLQKPPEVHSLGNANTTNSSAAAAAADGGGNARHAAAPLQLPPPANHDAPQVWFDIFFIQT